MEQKDSWFREVHQSTEEQIYCTPRVPVACEGPIKAKGTPVLEQPFSDYHVKVLLPQGEDVKSAKVSGRIRNTEGVITGTYGSNPLLNSIIYDVEFAIRAVKQCALYVIAENMYSHHIDNDGYSSLLPDAILDWKRDRDAVEMADKYMMTKSRQHRLHKTTKGWKLKFLWKDGSESWVPLKLLKVTHPLDVAKFSQASNIDYQPAFCW